VLKEMLMKLGVLRPFSVSRTKLALTGHPIQSVEAEAMSSAGSAF
jgi:hypothetical protein